MEVTFGSLERLAAALQVKICKLLVIGGERRDAPRQGRRLQSTSVLQVIAPHATAGRHVQGRTLPVV